MTHKGHSGLSIVFVDSFTCLVDKHQIGCSVISKPRHDATGQPAKTPAGEVKDHKVLRASLVDNAEGIR